MCNKPILLASLTLIILTLAACAKSQPEMVVEPEGPPDIRFPAEIYCTGLGYEYTTRERKIDKQEPQPETPVEPTPETLEGPHPGIPVVPDYILEVLCVFPDGKECEEWDFMSGLCGQEYTYCGQQGYKLEPGGNEATCVFPDGSSCLEFEFFNGDCGPATSQEIKDSSNVAIEIQCDRFYETPHITDNLQVKVGDEFTINLCSNASTGFRWVEMVNNNDPGILEQISHEFIGPSEDGDPPPPGTPGSQLWIFKALESGSSVLSFEYSRDWEGGEKGAWTLILTVDVK